MMGRVVIRRGNRMDAFDSRTDENIASESTPSGEDSVAREREFISSVEDSHTVEDENKESESTSEEEEDSVTSQGEFISSGENCDTIGVHDSTFRAALPDFIPSDGSDGEYASYASSINYCYSEEISDSDLDTEDNCRNHHFLAGFYYRSPKKAELYQASKPSKQEWKQGWPKEGYRTESAWVHVYSFYNEETNSGGYGVIVRNMAAEPIAASVYFSLYGVAYLYQVLKGIEAGLRLALEHGCSTPHVICNSRIVGMVFRRLRYHPCHHKPNSVCQQCMKDMVPQMTDGYFKHVAPLMDTLTGKLCSLNIAKQSRIWNRAAYYLAKQAKMTLLVYGWGYKDYEVDVKPKDFSVDLLNILWKDAFDTTYYNLEARAKILDAEIADEWKEHYDTTSYNWKAAAKKLGAAFHNSLTLESDD